MIDAKKLLLILLALTFCAVLPASGDTAEAWDYSADGDALTRGPLHEAYAQPVTWDAEDRFVVSQKPPEPIQEIPPAEKPAGDNVVWIPGYWHYDDDTNGFIWISGCWRAVPPGKSWMPGYWQETASGYEWVMGFWKDSGASNIVYLPTPPETLETGPSSAAPSPDCIWVPGCWVWQPGTVWRRSGYAWRPGFWVTARPDWVWVPAHYAYTPHGYVFVEGYWDYTLADRGVLFLPMRFSSSVYLRSGFCFSPRLVIGVDLICSDFFFSPWRRHYFFGDYYAVRYSSLGFYPWFAYRHRVMIHDHLYAHARWHHRHEPHWSRDKRKEFEHRRQYQDARPPRTYQQHNQLDRSRPDSRGQAKASIRPINEITRNHDGRRKFEKLDQRQREEFSRRGNDVESYRRGRSKWENPAPEGSRQGEAATPPSGRERPGRPGQGSGEATPPSGRERPGKPELGEATPPAGRERPGRPGPGEATPPSGRERPGRPGPGSGEAAPPWGRERPSRSVPVDRQVVQTEQSKRLSGSSRPSVDRPLPGYSESKATVLPARPVSGSAVDRRPARPQTVRVPESPIGNGSYSDYGDQAMPPELPQYETPRRHGSMTGSRSSGDWSSGGRRRMQSRP